MTFARTAHGPMPRRQRLRCLALAAASGIVPLLMALWITRPQAPLRAIAGTYFALILVPGLQLLAGAFFGRRVALAVGIVLAALTAWQVIGSPRPLEMQPVNWQAGFTASNQQLRAVLAPPPASQADHLLGKGGAAILFVCQTKGSSGDLEILFDGSPLPIVLRRPTAQDCWLQLSVPRDRLPPPGAPAEVTVRLRTPAAAVPGGGGDPVVILGGYTRPRSQGGRAGGAAFLDDTGWRSEDLSPIEPGVQRGRYFVELRITDVAGQVREVWY